MDAPIQIQKQREKIELYKSAFAGRTGALILEDLANQCFAHQPSWHPGKEIYSVFYNEGRRSVYLYIKSIVDADVNAVRPTQQETEME